HRRPPGRLSVAAALPPPGMKKAAPRAAFFVAPDARSPDKRSTSGNTQERVILETPDAPRGLRPGHADSRNRSLDLHVAEAVVPRGHGASRPWMACARALEPRTAEPRDAPCPPWDGGPVRSQLYHRCCCFVPM